MKELETWLQNCIEGRRGFPSAIELEAFLVFELLGYARKHRGLQVPKSTLEALSRFCDRIGVPKSLRGVEALKAIDAHFASNPIRPEVRSSFHAFIATLAISDERRKNAAKFFAARL